MSLNKIDNSNLKELAESNINKSPILEKLKNPTLKLIIK